MGPLASTKSMAEVEKQRREMIKLLNEEQRKERLNKVKVAAEIGKAQRDGIPIEKTLPLVAPPSAKKRPQGPLAAPTNPEAGPSDKVPALLTPGEAVIPASVAQDPQYKGIIEKMIQTGRNINDIVKSFGPSQAPLGSGAAANAGSQLGGRTRQVDQAIDQAQGFEDGTEKVKKKDRTLVDSIKTIWNAGSSLKKSEPTPVPEKDKAPEGGMMGNTVDAIRKRNEAIKGYADGTTGVTLTDEDVSKRESGGNPTAKNPLSSAYGEYQITDAARKDIFAVRPDLASMDQKDPAVQREQRNVFKGILSNQLKAKGVEPNPDNINRAWVAGADGLARIVNASADTPLESILSAEAIAKNPNLRGKTAGEFASDPNPYTRKDKDTAALVREVINPEVPPYSNEGRVKSAVEADRPRPAEQAWNRIKNAFTPTSIGYQEPAAPAASVMYEGASGAADENIPPPPASVMYEGDSTPVPAPRVTQAIPEPLKSETVSSTPVKEVDLTAGAVGQDNLDDNYSMSNAVANRIENLDNVLSSEEVKARLAAVQAQKPPPGVDMKDWLAKQLRKVYSDTGLFNERELIKFSVLAAGGLLTGGSVGGSLQYAGRAVINDSQARFSMQEQERKQKELQLNTQKYEAVKDARERLQSMEKQYSEMVGHASKEAHGPAFELFSKALKAKSQGDYAGAEQNFRAAIQVLGEARVQPGDNKAPTLKQYYDQTGKPVQGHVDPNGVPYILNAATQQYEKAPKGTTLIESGEHFKRIDEAKKSTATKIAGRLQKHFRVRGKDTAPPSEIKAQADMIAEDSISLAADLGLDVSASDFANIVEHAMMNMIEENKGKPLDDFSPEGFRRYVYGNAVIEMRKTNNLYKAANDEGKFTARPNAAAVASFGDVVRQTQKERGSNREDTVAFLEKGWQGLDEAKKKTYIDRAKGKPGWSPILLWASGQ